MHLEDGFAVAAGRDDVGAGVGLDALDGRALRTHHQPNHAHRHSHPDRRRRRRRAGRATPSAGAGRPAPRGGGGGGGGHLAAAAGPDLGEVVGGGEDLAARGVDVLLASGDDEDRFVAAHWCLDVCVGLVTQRLDLAALQRACINPAVIQRLGRITVQRLRCGLLLQIYGSVVSVSVCLSGSVEHSREPYKNGRNDRGAVCDVDSCGPKEPRIKWGPRSPR